MALQQADTAPLVLKPKSCIPCRTRKVKCDRNLPCKNCIQWSQTCVFPSPIRRCRRQRKDKPATGAASLTPDNADATAGENGSLSVDERLEKLERAVHELTGLVHDNISLIKQSQQHGQGLGQLSLRTDDQTVQKRPRSHHVRSPTFGSLNYLSPSAIPDIFSPMLQTFTDNPKLPSQIPFDYLASLHLHPIQVRTCWEVFKENVDPLAKVIHKPTVQVLLQKITTATTASPSQSPLTKGQEALLFAIYFSSICSLGAEDVERCFSMSKATAAMAYRSATYRALMRAEFLSSSDIFTLQAFTLYLTFTNKTDNTKETWALTGLARRLNNTALTMKLSPFEKELRTRLWWQLWYLDRRAVEDHGINREIQTATSDDIITPNLPLNVNDSDLHPTMTGSPPLLSRTGWTEISFCLVRFEISKTDRMIASTNTNTNTNNALSPSEKEYAINACEREIYTSYIQFCNDTLPIHWLAKHVSHVLITELRLKIYPHSHDRIHLNKSSTSTTLFVQAMEIIDIPTRLDAEPQAHRWKWLLSAYLQFLPLAFLLTELCSRYDYEYEYDNGVGYGCGYDDEGMIARAWDVVEGAFSRNEAGIKEAGNGGVLRELMGRAKMGRERERQRQRQGRMIRDEAWDVVGGLVPGPLPLESGLVFEEGQDGGLIQGEEQGLEPVYITPDEGVLQWDQNIYSI